MPVVLIKFAADIQNTRFLIFFVYILHALSQISDRIILAGNQKQRKRFRDLCDILRPVVKIDCLKQPEIRVIGKRKRTSRIRIVCLYDLFIFVSQLFPASAPVRS